MCSVLAVGNIRTPSPHIVNYKNVQADCHNLLRDVRANNENVYTEVQGRCNEINSDTIVPNEMQQYSNINGNSDNVAFKEETKSTFLNNDESTKEHPSALFIDKDEITTVLRDTRQVSELKSINNNIDTVLSEQDFSVSKLKEVKSELFNDLSSEETCGIYENDKDDKCFIGMEYNNISSNSLKRKSSADLNEESIGENSFDHGKKMRPNDSSTCALIKQEIVSSSVKTRCKSSLVENIDYKLLEGKRDVDLLTAIEMQTNVKLAKMEFRLSSSSDFSNSDRESPRKAQRTQSLDFAPHDFYSVIKTIEETKRPRSADCGSCDITFDFQLYSKQKKSEVPVKSNHKESKTRDKRDESSVSHKSEHRKSGSGRSYSDKRRHRNVGIQARPSEDHGRHDLKIMHARPSLLLSGNISYPPSDVSIMFSNTH